MSKYFHISKASSIRFAKRVDFATTYKNDENTLSCEVNVRLPYKEVQLWQTNDIIKNQFKSGYSLNEVFVIKQDLTEDAIQLIKKSENFGILIKMDAKIKASGNKTFIYFLTGNIYSPGTANVLETYTFGGELPKWAKVGNSITYNGLTQIIESIFFDEVTNADVVVLNYIYTGNSTNTIVECTYNSENFEVFEFEIEMANYQDQNIRLKIISTDGTETLEHLSEVQNISGKQSDTVNIKYKNSTNTDVNFGTGIEFELRQKASFINGISDESSEKYKTDTNIILLSSDIYEGDEFIFHPVTKEMMRKVISALSHDEVFINDVGYVKNEALEKEGPLGCTNLYHLKAKMLKNGLVYEKQLPPIVIPKLLEITETSWQIATDGTGRKDIIINFQANFTLTLLKYQLSESGLNWSPLELFSLSGITSPKIIPDTSNDLMRYVRIADINGSEITYSNSKLWYNSLGNAPTGNIVWNDTLTNENRIGSNLQAVVNYINIQDLDGDSVNIYWQENIGSGFVDIQQTNATPFVYNLSSGVNKFRIKIIDNGGLVGYSNELTYRKIVQQNIIETISENSSLCNTIWDVKINSQNQDLLINVLLQTTSVNGTFWSYLPTSGYALIDSNQSNIPLGANNDLLISFGINGSNSGIVNQSTTIMVEVFDTNGNFLENQQFLRLHSINNC